MVSVVLESAGSLTQQNQTKNMLVVVPVGLKPYVILRRFNFDQGKACTSQGKGPAIAWRWVGTFWLGSSF